MTVGLQVINDDGIVQIDENYRNLVFIQKWTFSTAGDHTITASGRTIPMLALYSTNSAPTPTAGIVLLETSISNGTYTWRVNGIGEVYLFDVPDPPPAHGFGLQVFDSAGKIVFDSSTKPLLVRDVHQFKGYHDFYSVPIQTLAMLTSPNGYDIMEEGSNAAYAKPSSQKWGWMILDSFQSVAFINTPSAGGPSSSPYGPGDGNIHKGLAAIYASGNNFVVTHRDIMFSGGTWSGNIDWQTMIAFVDLTGL